MRHYRMTGYIQIESSGEAAEYDFVMEWSDLVKEPTEMDVLNYMLSTGDIQIIHDSSVPSDSEGEPLDPDDDDKVNKCMDCGDWLRDCICDDDEEEKEE